MRACHVELWQDDTDHLSFKTAPALSLVWVPRSALSSLLRGQESCCMSLSFLTASLLFLLFYHLLLSFPGPVFLNPRLPSELSPSIAQWDGFHHLLSAWLGPRESTSQGCLHFVSTAFGKRVFRGRVCGHLRFMLRHTQNCKWLILTPGILRL